MGPSLKSLKVIFLSIEQYNGYSLNKTDVGRLDAVDYLGLMDSKYK